MVKQRLDPEEEALWRRVTETIRPIHPRSHIRSAAVSPPIAIPQAKPRIAIPEKLRAIPIAEQQRAADTLDGGWDRRLRRGVVMPDRTLDLHGHTLLSAHQALDHGLDRALADSVRVLLVITGKPPRDHRDGEGPPKRGAIRAAIGDWLGSSRHASRIAAVRNAHPRHGGAGALYVILRRVRELG